MEGKGVASDQCHGINSGAAHATTMLTATSGGEEGLVRICKTDWRKQVASVAFTVVEY